jgi:transcriptional regulator with XRE-family HTH domain
MDQKILDKNINNSTALVRSRLFNLEPIGIGTPYIESLSSYIARLASNHYLRVGDLLKHIILVKLDMTHYLFDSNRSRINKFGQFTDKLISVLEELTSRTDLKYLTLKKWESVFINCNITFNPHLRWCPRCLTYCRDNNMEIYEPLIWSISCIKICPKHKIELSTVCHHCNKYPRTFTSKAKPGYCPHCENWLGEEYHCKEVTGLELKRQLMLSNAVGELLSHNNVDSPSVSNNRITVSIKIIMKTAANGKIKKFAKLINKTPYLVSQWIKGRRHPEFESLLDICEATNIKVVDLLLDRLDYYSIELINIPQRKIKKNYIRRDLKHIETHLENSYLNEYPPPSLAELKRRLNYNKIGERFPVICKKIKHKYQDYKKTQREIIMMNKIKDVEEIMKDLHINFEYPNVDLVRSKMKSPSSFRDPLIRETYQQMLRELGLK